MAIQTRKNLYRGINPHFNSLLQTPGNEVDGPSLWLGFHANHITDIANALNSVLPEKYLAIPEQSLQIKAEDVDLNFIRTKKRQPDVAIYRQPGGGLSTLAVSDATLTIDLEASLDHDEDFVTAVLIRDMSEGTRAGKVVTRIELLSPSNKPGNYGYEFYRENRNETIYSGVPLIELDFLYEGPPPVRKCPVYPHQEGSHPYNIYINLPRQKIVTVRGFDVDAAFPKVVIPLAGDDKLEFEFGAVYHFTYRAMRWGIHHDLVDYTQLPARFHTYSPADQERIHGRMAAIAEAHARGEKLDDER
jgi:Protein of unknown function (DUF4058)